MIVPREKTDNSIVQQMQRAPSTIKQRITAASKHCDVEFVFFDLIKVFQSLLMVPVHVYNTEYASMRNQMIL